MISTVVFALRGALLALFTVDDLGRGAYFAHPRGNYWEVAWSDGDNPVTDAARRAAGQRIGP